MNSYEDRKMFDVYFIDYQYGKLLNSTSLYYMRDTSDRFHTYSILWLYGNNPSKLFRINLNNLHTVQTKILITDTVNNFLRKN